MAKQILSGIQQSVYTSFADAQKEAYKGKLLFARVSGATGSEQYGWDTNGKLISGTAGDVQGKTYVFFGNKVYGSFPQLPVELLKTLGVSIDEANTGVITSLTQYFTASSITEILKELKNNAIQSDAKTLIVTSETDGDKTYTNVEVNYDGNTIKQSADTKVLYVDSEQISAVTEIKSNDATSAIASIVSAKTEGSENVTYTIGFSGGTNGQVIKKSGETYVWADPAGVTLSGLSGVTVSAGTPENGVTPYNIFSNLSISSVTNGEAGSGLVTSYKLVDKDGQVYGQEIKTINDVFLKEVSAGTSGDVDGLLFTWYVRTPEDPTGTQTAQTFVSLADLNNYKAGSGITLDVKGGKDTIIAKISEDANNIIGYSSTDSGLVAHAVQEVYVNGTKLTGAGNTVSASSIVSAVSATVNGTVKETSFSGEVLTGGMMNLNVSLSAEDVAFDSTNIEKINPALSGKNVQEVVKELVDLTSASTSGVLTITVNGKDSILSVGTYNPSASTTIYIPQLSALTIGAEEFEFNTSATSAHIQTINSSAVTYSYAGTGNTDSAFTGESKPTTVSGNLELIIDKLNDSNVTGLSAISATVTETGTTVQLNLNESNTKSYAGGMIESDYLAVASGSSLTSTTPTNAVKLVQSEDHGLGAYIEIAGDDLDDLDDLPTPTTQHAMFYTAGENANTALGPTAEIVG